LQPASCADNDQPPPDALFRELPAGLSTGLSTGFLTGLFSGNPASVAAGERAQTRSGKQVTNNSINCQQLCRIASLKLRVMMLQTT
jgi:hypothetical protein